MSVQVTCIRCALESVCKSVSDRVLSVQTTEFTLTGAKGLLNSDSISQILGNPP